MPIRVVSSLALDAASLLRAFHPMVVCFGGALGGTALLFDVIYLKAGTGIAFAALYTVPLLAGLIACLIAAADDLALERRVVSWTVATTVALGLTNVVGVAFVAAVSRTGPSDWRSGGQAVLLSVCCLPCFALVAVALRNLARNLGIDVQTRLPQRSTPAAPPTTRPVRTTGASQTPRAARPARAAHLVDAQGSESQGSEPRASVDLPRAPQPAEPVEESFLPRRIDLAEPREVLPAAGSAQHGDGRVARSRSAHSTATARQVLRPGRPPDPGRFRGGSRGG